MPDAKPDAINVCDEDSLRFHFPVDWHVSQYDKTTFYRKKLEKIKPGKDEQGRNIGDPKAVDFVALSPDGALWLIEVKDFRGHRIENKDRINSGELINEVIKKTLDTMAGLWLSYYLRHEELAQFTATLNPDQSVCVVLWLEQDPIPSRLNPPNKSKIDLESDLRRRLKPLGLKGTLSSMSIPGKTAWTVEHHRESI